MNIRKILLIIFVVISGLLGIIISGSLFSQDLLEYSKVEVIEIIDGDTIKVKDLENRQIFKVRYLGIDAPEPNGKDYETCFSNEAMERNKELVSGKTLLLEYDLDRYDRFGRTLAYVYTEDGTFVNLELIENGFARFFLDSFNTLHQEEFLRAAMDSQENYLGLWGICGEDRFQNKCLIKGNVGTNDYYSKFYHLPGDSYYENTVVNLENGDKWFCTIEEAEANGFENPY